MGLKNVTIRAYSVREGENHLQKNELGKYRDFCCFFGFCCLLHDEAMHLSLGTGT